MQNLSVSTGVDVEPIDLDGINDYENFGNTSNSIAMAPAISPMDTSSDSLKPPVAKKARVDDRPNVSYKPVVMSSKIDSVKANLAKNKDIIEIADDFASDDGDVEMEESSVQKHAKDFMTAKQLVYCIVCFYNFRVFSHNFAHV